MRRAVIPLLLILQLHPVVCAVLCLPQSTAANQVTASAPLPTSNHDEALLTLPPAGPMPSPDADCPINQLCAVPVGALLGIQPHLSVKTVDEVVVVPPRSTSLLAADPTAPLVPPPT